MRVKIKSIKDKNGVEREDKFYSSMIGKLGETQQITAREKMTIKLDREHGEDHVYLKTSTVSEVSQRGKNITVRTTNSVYQLEAVEQ